MQVDFFFFLQNISSCDINQNWANQMSVNCWSFKMFTWEQSICHWTVRKSESVSSPFLFSCLAPRYGLVTIYTVSCFWYLLSVYLAIFLRLLPFLQHFYSLHLFFPCVAGQVVFHQVIYFTKWQLVSFSPRLHVQSPTCSSRSSSISASCTRLCWWSSSSSSFPLIPPPPPLPRLVCILPVALFPVNQSWIPSQVPIRLRASPTHCTPKSRRLRPMPTTPILSVRLLTVGAVL